MFLQLPRLYNIYKEMGIVTSFQTILDNVFLPLFEVTVDPSSHPQLHVFLKQVWLFKLAIFSAFLCPALSYMFCWYSIETICCFILQVVGLDLVDDESKPERRPTKHMPTPSQWTNIFNPAFSYYVYYCYANLYTLNKASNLMYKFTCNPHVFRVLLSNTC